VRPISDSRAEVNPLKQKILVGCLVVLSIASLGLFVNLYVKWVRQEIQNALERDVCDIQRMRQRIATQDTALFINQNMAKVPTLADRNQLFDWSLHAVDPRLNGLYAEFGVGSGGTVNTIASKTDHIIHGFDSFEGLPETWRTGFEKGAFDTAGLPKVRDNVRLHKGWFNESLPVWAKENKGPMAFMHMDADLYSSTKTVLDILADRIVPGTVLQFDEYFNYPGWQEGEFKAFKEFVEKNGVKFEYLGYTSGDDSQQVAVRIQSVGQRSAE
jgi:hypothetical protein